MNRGSEEEEEGEGERGRTTLRGGGLAKDDGVLPVIAVAVELAGAAAAGRGRKGRNLQRGICRGGKEERKERRETQ